MIASSSSVYGETPTLPKVETMPTSPVSPYAAQKYLGELYCRQFHALFGLKTVALRYFNIFGPRQNPHSQYSAVIPKFIAAALEGRTPVIFGDGKQVRDVLFVTDLIDAYRRAIDRIDRASGKAFNLGGGAENTLSLLELMDTLEELTGRDVVHSFADWRPGDQPVFVSDIRRARAELGWSPRIPPHDGVASLYDWVVNHMDLFR